MRKRGLIIVVFISLTVISSCDSTTKQNDNIQDDITVTNSMNKKQSITSASTYTYPSVKTVDLDENTAYIKIPTFVDAEMKKGLSIIRPYLQTISDKNKLIIDVRDNSGGNDEYWRALVEHIIIEPITWTSYFFI